MHKLDRYTLARQRERNEASLERLRKAEARAWSDYQAARARLSRKVNATTQLAMIEAGERWQRCNDRLFAA